MGGVGGPLLCIGDLLSDIGDSSQPPDLNVHSSSPISNNTPAETHDLPNLFQENFKNLNEALAGSDHSWTGLTLKLCAAVETANKLVETANSSARSLSGKVEELERVVRRGDAAVAALRGVVSPRKQ